MDKFISNSYKKTAKIAQKLAKSCKIGDVLLLFGDLGAGKTAFVKGFAKEFGKAQVTSPTFTIINTYDGKIPIYHFDLYRLEKEGVKTITDELTEDSKDGVLTLVEWAEFSDIELPFDRIEIKIGYVDDTVRTFDFYALGDYNKKIVEGLKTQCC